MSRPSDTELARLTALADEVLEIVAARGYRVDVAVGADAAFDRGVSRSWLTRDLVMDAVSEAASHSGDVDFRPVNGLGRELRCHDPNQDVIRTFRCLRARRRADGTLHVQANTESALTADEEASLFPEERWVLLYTVGGESLIDEIVIAPIVGFDAGKPGNLRLGPETAITSTPTTPSATRFMPADEEQLGIFDDDLGNEDEGTA